MSPVTTEPEVVWSKRPGWEDLEPVPQNDAPNALVPIAYDEYCESLFSDWRAAGGEGDADPIA